jgi:hypothetical protein
MSTGGPNQVVKRTYFFVPHAPVDGELFFSSLLELPPPLPKKRSHKVAVSSLPRGSQV